MKQKRTLQSGSVDGWMIGTIGCLVLFVIAAALGVWAFLAYSNEKTNVDNRIAVAVAEGKREQSAEDQKKFDESYKNPKIEFVGPAEYGRLSFMYPKTWSVYVEKDGSDRGDYKAYLHPMTVPPVAKSDSRFALRVEILNTDFDRVLNQYSNALKKGDLKSSSIQANGNTATRIDGEFSKDLRGSAVLMRVRDKTIRLSTDADVFKPDFQEVLSTVKFVE